MLGEDPLDAVPPEDDPDEALPGPVREDGLSVDEDEPDMPEPPLLGSLRARLPPLPDELPLVPEEAVLDPVPLEAVSALSRWQAPSARALTRTRVEANALFMLISF